jgi:hypothetical protein
MIPRRAYVAGRAAHSTGAATRFRARRNRESGAGSTVDPRPPPPTSPPFHIRRRGCPFPSTHPRPRPRREDIFRGKQGPVRLNRSPPASPFVNGLLTVWAPLACQWERSAAGRAAHPSPHLTSPPFPSLPLPHWRLAVYILRPQTANNSLNLLICSCGQEDGGGGERAR